MRRRINVRIKNNVIDEGKEYAMRKDKSLSRIIEESLENALKKAKKTDTP